jgi:hypothetical protein
MLAAGSGHLACVRTLLESGAVSDVDQQDQVSRYPPFSHSYALRLLQDGRTALHHASYYGWFPSALFLIQAAVANPYLPDQVALCLSLDSTHLLVQSQRCAMDLIRIGFSDSEVEEIEAHLVTSSFRFLDLIPPPSTGGIAGASFYSPQPSLVLATLSPTWGTEHDCCPCAVSSVALTWFTSSLSIVECQNDSPAFGSWFSREMEKGFDQVE